MNIVSFSLFGPASIYTYGAVRNAMLVNDIFYSGWTTRFYVTDTVPQDILALLRYHDAQIVHITKRDVPSPIFGRLLVMNDPSVNCWICREAEARLSIRERQLVNAWLHSGKRWHVIKDHSGCGMHPVYTGCFGGWAHVPDISAKMFAWASRQEKPVVWTEEKAGWFFRNQEFVRDTLWPQMLADGTLIHWSRRASLANSSFSHYRESFPHARLIESDAPGYVGEAIGFDEKPVAPGLRDYQ